MEKYYFIVFFVLAGSITIGEIVDLMAYPMKFPRRIKSFPLRVLPVIIFNCLILLITGSVFISLSFSLVVMLILVIGSNLKLRTLNEPLVFTDLTLISSFIKHPGFYIQAVPVFLRYSTIFIIVSLCVFIPQLLSLDLYSRLIGLIIGSLSCALLWLFIERNSRAGGPEPDLWEDFRQNGIFPTLLLYAARSYRLPPLGEKKALPYKEGAPESVIIIQCESYADPVQINPKWDALPVLEAARKEALQWGNLYPSGLGAYTMRSEYSALCGDDDASLSYRQFDPFLTAQDRSSHALPQRLKNFYKNTLFLHPYDLQFYGRDQLLPGWGFTEVVGRGVFKETDKLGPYVSDAALAKFLSNYLRQNKNFLAYTVTIENHGPWKGGRLGKESGAEAWYEHAQHSDVMLGTILSAIKTSGRDIMLVFFGDHRPALKPFPLIENLDRTTPYVILRPNVPKNKSLSPKEVNLTIAQLHAAILENITT